ncbi:MAG TPA: DUF4256 domain-containing protein [Flavobacterium sp.]|jgi:hypothetical protein
MSDKILKPEQREVLLSVLKNRFEKNRSRHSSIKWTTIESKLETHPEKLWSLHKMEETGGEPDVVALGTNSNEFLFVDCSAESPKGRRSICYDREGLESRKEHQPANNAVDMATEMGISLLTPEYYRELQKLGPFDTKTSSWLQTPEEIRLLGGALFGDYRYGTVFVYHNGAQSYYAVRGFRGFLSI